MRCKSEVCLQGIVSGTGYAGKRTSLMLFINGRPVECSPLKRAIEITYTSLLPKAAKPWVFLASPSPTPACPGVWLCMCEVKGAQGWALGMSLA